LAFLRPMRFSKKTFIMNLIKYNIGFVNSLFLLFLTLGCSHLSEESLDESFASVKNVNQATSITDLKIVEEALVNSGHFKGFKEIVDKGYTVFIHPENEGVNKIALVRSQDMKQGGCGGNYLIRFKERTATLLSGESEISKINNGRLLIFRSDCVTRKAGE